MISPENQSTKQLLQEAQAGNPDARDALVRQNLPLVKYVVRRFLDRGHEYDDLYQYGCMGLIKAIDRFDIRYDVAFSTYAVPVIMGEIRRFLRDNGPVHIARSIHDNALRIQRFRSLFLQTHEAEPTIPDISEALGMEREDVLLAINAAQQPRSLNEPVGSDSDTQLMDILGRDEIPVIDMRLTLAKLLQDLQPDERKLILQRFFSQRTQTDIAREMGLSQVQVSRMESRILKKMRRMAEN